MERELEALEGVDWATVNQTLGRVIVAFDGEQTDVEDIVDVVETVEQARGVSHEEFPAERPDHPGDDAPVRHEAWALAMDLAGAGVGSLARTFRTNVLSAEVAALVGLVEATPALRRPLEAHLGPAADLGLAAVHSFAQSFAGTPLSLLVDAAHRALLLRELSSRRAVWELREPTLCDATTAGAPAVEAPPSSRPLPPGPAERFAQRSSAAAFAAAVGALAATRDPRLAVAATVAGNPKAARLGVDAFAATLGRLLAQRGVVPMDREVLRRLDRVDTVVLDSDALMTGASKLGSTWVPPDVTGDPAESERRWLASLLLFEPDDPSRAGRSDGWVLAPVREADLAGDRRAVTARRVLRHSGTAVLGLSRDEELLAMVAVEPQLDPFAGVLAAAARETGSLVVAGRGAGVGERLGADREVRGGTALAGQVRELQQEGHVVAVVSARHHAGLAAADVGIGVDRPGQRPPWGADLLTSRGLLDAWLILNTVPAARKVAHRSASCAAYGSGAAGLLALAGARRGATSRAGMAVNGAAAVSMAAGNWAAKRADADPGAGRRGRVGVARPSRRRGAHPRGEPSRRPEQRRSR